jgi:hypothetical protein
VEEYRSACTRRPQEVFNRRLVSVQARSFLCREHTE